MTRDINFYEQIEDYCSEQLSNQVKLEFETELAINPELRNEVALWSDIQNALLEKEILKLRERIKAVSSESTFNNDSNNSFDILNEISDIEILNETLSPEDLINYFDSLPKVHAYHHETLAIENVHQFYKRQNGYAIKGKIADEFNDSDLDEFNELDEAILEKDIIQLRQTLSQVAKSIEPQYSVEQIENYLSGELNGSELIDFERDMIFNKTLQNDVQLHRDIDSALQEPEILELRNKMSKILKTETSWKVSEKSIEDFIDGYLEEEFFDEFNTELNDNPDLFAEVKLRRQVNAAIGETEIINLRAKLKSVKESTETRKVQMLIPETKSGYIKYWRSSVAVLVILMGLAGVMSNNFVSVNKTYNHYFELPVWSPERSAAIDFTFEQQINYMYNNAEYEKLLESIQLKFESSEITPMMQFYQAVSYQRLGKFQDAITLYSSIINQGDNLFIEEAEWYRSLSYLKAGNNLKAKNDLLAIIEKRGHYEKNAKAVLRRLRYTLR